MDAAHAVFVLFFWPLVISQLIRSNATRCPHHWGETKWKETQCNHMPGGIKQFHYWLAFCPPSTSHQLLTHLHCTSFRTRWYRHCPRLSQTYSATTTEHRDAFLAPVQEATLKDICLALWYSAAKCGLLLSSLSLLCPPALFLTCVLRLRNWKLRAQMTLHTPPQADIFFCALIWYSAFHVSCDKRPDY